MGIWNKKTTLIKINNNEKGFIQVKETIQASHQQWNIKKITIFFRSGKSWFGLVNHLGSPDRMSCKKNYKFRIHWYMRTTWTPDEREWNRGSGICRQFLPIRHLCLKSIPIWEIYISHTLPQTLGVSRRTFDSNNLCYWLSNFRVNPPAVEPSRKS
jgi:hypothetical protein